MIKGLFAERLFCTLGSHKARKKEASSKKQRGKDVSKEKEKIKMCGLEEKKKCGKGEICCTPYSQGLLREFLGLFQKVTYET